jgi:acyl carrier protein
MNESAHERLQEIVRMLFNDSRIVLADDTTPSDIPGWDSLASVNVQFSVEQEFGVEFGDDEFRELETIGDLKSALVGKGVRS